ncbi:O-antigen translocase [Limnohabitans curvus]|uniref:O-antigen translocase n=1 Tax=Limnohabitans curvus TaxID=323423 RepID=A0A315EUD4_9BURK|nr:O-antigen translocase [Limnohabitans curvus]PUE59624.1 O-antigen translocase [Limnohabitans curvus]
MTLIKTSLLNAIAVGVRMLTLLGINKILAIYVGPAGYAALGQFQNAVQMISTLASGAINTGVTKYTAEYHEDEALQRAVWQTSGTIALAGSVLLGVLVFAFKTELAQWFLNDESLASVFGWFAATLVLFVFNTLLLAIINGKKDINRYVVANIAGSVFSLLVTAVMVVQWGLLGALIGFAIYQSLAFFVTLALCVKTPWFRISYLFGRIDKEVGQNMAKYAAMALTSAATIPLSHILIRNHLAETLGWQAAGYWEAMWRLSGVYLLLLTTTLSVYYLPRLSELKKKDAIKKEIFVSYIIIVPVAVLGSLSMYFLRDILLELLFTRDFIPVRELFGWQMIGDTIKISSWILSYVVLGKAMYKTFIFSEITHSILFVITVLVLTSYFGIEGVVIAHAATYLLYLGAMIAAVMFYLKKLKE